MIISGYAKGFPDSVEVDRLLYDGSELVREREFWAAHFLSQSMEDEDLLIDVWGIEPGALRGMQARLSDQSAWPVFQCSLGGEARLVVVYRNVEDDAGVDYLLVPGADRDCIRIATLEGEYEGPGISWLELLGVSRTPSNSFLQAEILLLFAPMLGDVEAAGSIGLDALAQAVQSCGGAGDAESVASAIAAENLQWEPAQWYTTDAGLRVCNAESSPRNPESPVALASDDLHTVSRILAA